MSTTKCCVMGCTEDARIFLSNNLFEWTHESIPFCNHHFELYNKHMEAREKLFRKECSSKTSERKVTKC